MLPSDTRTGAFYSQFAVPPVVTDQAVPVTGPDLGIIWEPEPTPPLLESGALLDREGSFDLIEKDPIAVHELTSEAFHRWAPL